MKTITIRNLILIFVIALVSMSCLALSKNRDIEQDLDGPVGIDAQASAPDEMMDEEGGQVVEDYVYDEGGFKFSPILGWEINCAIGIIQMKAPDADGEYGPVFLIMAGDNDVEMTTDEAFAIFQETSTGAEVGDPEKIKVGGFPGLMAEMTSQQGDMEIKALAVTSMLTSKRQFTMMASSPSDRWEDEIAPYFDDVLDSIKFIDIVPDAGCPTGWDASGSQEPDMDDFEEQEGLSIDGDGMLRQWANSARASSEYGDEAWSAMQATGAPNVDECEDSINAWASERSNSKEWLELTYDVPVVPTEIAIYSSYNPSQIYEVDIIDVDGNEYIARETKPQLVEYCPDLYQIFLELDEEIYINKVKIYIDQSKLNLGWHEIDAVELIGYPEDGAVVSQKPQTTSGQSQGGAASPYQPDELDPGSYAYDVSGYENDVVMGANVLYQSTSDTYIIGLMSGNERYIVNFMLPKDKLQKGVVQMAPYNTAGNQKDLTAAIAINAFLYIAESGEYNFTVDPNTGKISGTFYFKAQSKDFPDRAVEVAGSFNDITLK